MKPKGSPDHSSSSSLASFNNLDYVPPIQEIFDWIEDNFDRLLSGLPPIANILRLLQRSILEAAVEGSSGTGGDKEEYKVGLHWLTLVSKHHDDEAELTMMLHLLHQILSTNTEHLDICPEVLETLIDLIVGDSAELASSQSTLTLANILSCVQLYIQKCPDVPRSKVPMQKLWLSVVSQSSEQPPSVPARSAQVLVYLFDEFMLHDSDLHRNPRLVDIMRQLLVSELSDQRKMACYLIRKASKVEIEQMRPISAFGMDTTNILTRSWNAYLNVMESLEGNQWQLMLLPALEAFKDLSAFWHGWLERPSSWHMWLDILYKRMLGHSNKLVTRWTIEYLLTSYTCDNLSAETLAQFLEAVNDPKLYNGERGGYFLPQTNIVKFFHCDHTEFWKSFAKVNWKSVPLHFWLKQLAELKTTTVAVSQEVLLKIATKVSELENPNISEATVSLFGILFGTAIESLDLAAYVNLIESLYNFANNSSLANTWDIFLKKLEQNPNMLTSNNIISKRFYDIIISYHVYRHNYKLVFNDAVKFLIDLPKESHGWLRFLICFHTEETPEIVEFCKSKYDIDLNALKTVTLSELIDEFSKKLILNKCEKTFVKEAAVDFFVRRRLKKFSDLENFNLKSEELLKMGSQHTLRTLSSLLAEHEEKLDSSVLYSFLDGIKKFYKKSDVFQAIISEIFNHCRPDQITQYIEYILNIDLENINICKIVFLYYYIEEDSLIRGIMLGEVKTGDARIEEFYENMVNPTNSKIVYIRYEYLEDTKKEKVKYIVERLFNLNDDLSRKNPQYLENSVEHHLKVRIVSAIWYFIHKDSKLRMIHLWKLVLFQNNHPSVACMFEVCTAHSTPIDDILEQWKQISTCSPKQLKSLICITHAKSILNLKESNGTEIELAAIIEALLPLTMAENFQTRLYSQLATYSILDNYSKKSILLPNGEQTKKAISTTVGDAKITDLLEDVRLNWPFLEQDNCLIDKIMYITNGPFNEYKLPSDLCSLKKSKAIFAKNCTELIAGDTIEQATGMLEPQLNSMTDVLVKGNLTAYSGDKTIEIYVVATLIENPSNLGAIASTCAAHGIKNFVVDSISHNESCYFQDLDITAQKNFNIIGIKPAALGEFLIQKQTEGFEIVGTEKTANSTSLVDFKFPKKCILLFGHEQYGIPAHLISFFNYNVESPMFRLAGSLNVPLTSSLLMWEYCKQHMNES